MAKPTISETKLEWASSDIVDPVSSQDNKVEPSSTKKTDGWVFLEKPPFNWFNYWMNLVYQYIYWIVTEALEGVFTFTGVKTFSSIPVLPSSDPTTDNQAVRKAYVDSGIFINPYLVKQIGNDLSVSCQSPAITALSDNRIALINVSTVSITTYDFDGTDWSQVGNSLNVVSCQSPAITALSDNRIVMIETINKNITTYDFDGTDWSQVGNSLNVGSIGLNRITALSDNRIVLYNYNNTITTYDFDGTDWSQVGNSLNVGYTSKSITTLDSNRIVLINSVNRLTTYDFDGTDWSQVGNYLTIASISTGTCPIFGFSNFVIALAIGAASKIVFYKFINNNWESCGNEYQLSGVSEPTITGNSIYNLSYIDQNNDKLQMYEISWDLFRTPFEEF